MQTSVLNVVRTTLVVFGRDAAHVMPKYWHGPWHIHNHYFYQLPIEETSPSLINIHIVSKQPVDYIEAIMGLVMKGSTSVRHLRPSIWDPLVS